MTTRLSVLTVAIVAALAFNPVHAAHGDDLKTTAVRSAPPQTDGDQTTSAAEQDRQSRKAEPKTLATITVTATKRAQLMQDVPVSIDVVTAQDIETAGLTTARDLRMLVPALNFVTLPAQGTSNVVVRGLSETIGEPNVSFFIDGVYIPSRDALDFMLDGNIARVEVAKGPQYALYGQNSFAGAVNFVTKVPSSEPEGSIMVGMGNHDRRKFRAVASGPFSEGSNYHYRVGANEDDFGGFYRNEMTGHKLDKQRRTGAFLTLTGSPTSRINGRFNLIYNRTWQRGLAQQFVENNGDFFPPFNNNQMYFGKLPSLTDGFAVTPGHNRMHSILSSFSLNYDMDWATLTSVTSYNHRKYNNFYDSDYSAAPVQMTYSRGSETSIAEDLRLVSQTDGSIDWLVGLYYYHLKGHPIDETVWVGPAAPIFGGLTSDNHKRTRSVAVYASVTWHITPHWDLGVVMRKTRETKSIDTLTTAMPAATNPTGSVTPFQASSKFTPFTPGVNLAWKPSRTTLFYASAVKAIKVGGFNTFTTNGAIAPDERAYKPEKSTTYEVGAKFSPLDGRMILDLDVYKIQWRDQIVRTVGSMGALLNINAGQTKSQGAEASLQYDPDRVWSFRLGAAYNDAKYVQYVFPIVGLVGLNPDLSGVQLQYSPHLTANLSILNRIPLSNGWTWTTRVDGRYRDRMVAVQTGDAYTPSKTIFNLRTSLDIGHSQISFWVKNIFNDKGAPSSLFATSPRTTFDFATGRRPGNALFQALVLAPRLRTFGIDYRYRF